jgi:hypothetical protein
MTVLLSIISWKSLQRLKRSTRCLWRVHITEIWELLCYRSIFVRICFLWSKNTLLVRSTAILQLLFANSTLNNRVSISLWITVKSMNTYSIIIFCDYSIVNLLNARYLFLSIWIFHTHLNFLCVVKQAQLIYLYTSQNV